MLTGKCSEDFIDYIANDDSITEETKYIIIVHFKTNNIRAIYAYIVDFFDSVGIYIEIWAEFDLDEGVEFYGVDVNDYLVESVVKTRNEARQKAIEKANSIYNSKA